MQFRIRTRTQLSTCIALILAGAIVGSELIFLAFFATSGSQELSRDSVLWLACAAGFAGAFPAIWLLTRITIEARRTEQELSLEADTDGLTGLTNRRCFMRHGGNILARAEQRGQTAALLVIDADHFKQINDHYGHAMGDTALEAIAEQLRGSFRRTDLVGRLGGEEFAVLLPETDTETARMLAERVVQRIGRTPISGNGCIIEVTVSCGYADTRVSYEMDALFEAADKALYNAKENGRNRVSTWDQAYAA